jgi:hypothetical protein
MAVAIHLKIDAGLKDVTAKPNKTKQSEPCQV